MIEEMPFHRVASLLESLERIKQAPPSATAKRTQHLRHLIGWMTPLRGGDLHCLYRLLMPEVDHERVYWIKEARLAACMTDVWALRGTERGKRLLKWKESESGDLSVLLASYFHQGKVTSSPSLCLINESLDLLCKVGSADHFDWASAKKLLTQLFMPLSSGVEVKWLTRIILKNTLLDIAPQIFMDALHRNMYRLWQVRQDLRAACSAMQNLLESGTPSTPIRPMWGVCIGPMLCGRAKGVQHAIERLRRDPKSTIIWVEKKLDGERIQAHLRGSECRIYSKSGRDSTAKRSSVIPFLLEAFGSDTDCIMEGELLVWNEATAAIEPFGTVQGGYSSDCHLMVILWDLLWSDGISLLRKPLMERRSMLEQKLRPLKNRVELSPIDIIDLSDDPETKLASLYAECLANRHEGLILKPANSFYLPNHRGCWLKLKRDYIEGFGDTLDFACIGMSYGPQSAGLLDTLTLACPLDAEDPSFKVAFTVSIGLTKEELVLLNEKIRPLLNKHSSFHCQDTDVHFHLREPFIVEVLGSSFVPSARPSEWTLRHPRIRRIHLDRGWQDSVTWSEYQSIAREAVTPNAQEFTPLQSLLLEIGSSSAKRPNRVSVDGTLNSPLKRFRFETEEETILIESTSESEPIFLPSSEFSLSGTESCVVLFPSSPASDMIYIPDSQSQQL